MNQAVITGVAGYVPDYILTNAELETMVDTNDQWITERTGIKERRILKGEKQGVSELGLKAVQELLKKTNTNPEDVDLVIFCTVTGDYRFPDTGTVLCDKAGLKNAFGFDLGAACSGFLYGLFTGANFVMAGSYNKVIVVGADKMSSIMDYTDRSTCILFGDGAGAVMLEPSQEKVGIQNAILRGDGSGGKELCMLGGGSVNPTSQYTLDNKMHNVYQNGRVVFKNAVKGMSTAVRDVMKKSNLQPEDIKWVVPHQANLRIIEAVAKYLEFPMERVMVNIHKYGNTTSGTIPLCLKDYESNLKKGDNLILTSFGGGYTWGAIHLIWGYDGK